MLKIQFNIQSAAEPGAEILEIADDNELATATSMKEECAVLEVREPKDMTIDMVDVVDGSHDFTIDESSEAQIIVEESVDDGPKLDDGYSNSDKTVDEENEEEDMITIVNDTEYLVGSEKYKIKVSFYILISIVLPGRIERHGGGNCRKKCPTDQSFTKEYFTNSQKSETKSVV